MTTKTRMKKLLIEDYLQGNSILLRDTVTGCVLSLPNTKGRSGELFVDESLLHVFNAEIPLHSRIEWVNDGEYVTIYKLPYVRDCPIQSRLDSSINENLKV